MNCACGCGAEITSKRISPSTGRPAEYRSGHNRRGQGVWGDWSDPETHRRYRKAHPEKWVLSNRKQQLKKYGLTPAQYDDMLEAQDGVCALCHKPSPAGQLAVDHCHETGAVRGLLCHRCNTALGLLNDDPVLMVGAAHYVVQARTGRMSSSSAQS